jgi:hypothetical protein
MGSKRAGQAVLVEQIAVPGIDAIYTVVEGSGTGKPILGPAKKIGTAKQTGTEEADDTSASANCAAEACLIVGQTEGCLTEF